MLEKWNSADLVQAIKSGELTKSEVNSYLADLVLDMSRSNAILKKQNEDLQTERDAALEELDRLKNEVLSLQEALARREMTHNFADTKAGTENVSFQDDHFMIHDSSKSAGHDLASLFADHSEPETIRQTDGADTEEKTEPTLADKNQGLNESILKTADTAAKIPKEPSSDHESKKAEDPFSDLEAQTAKGSFSDTEMKKAVNPFSDTEMKKTSDSFSDADTKKTSDPFPNADTEKTKEASQNAGVPQDDGTETDIVLEPFYHEDLMTNSGMELLSLLQNMTNAAPPDRGAATEISKSWEEETEEITGDPNSANGQIVKRVRKKTEVSVKYSNGL